MEPATENAAGKQSPAQPNDCIVGLTESLCLRIDILIILLHFIVAHWIKHSPTNNQVYTNSAVCQALITF